MNTDFSAFDRHPAVAGQFYPADARELEKQLERLFQEAVPKNHEQVRAIISPHAGYVFSGRIAASAFNQIDTSVACQRVFILGSSHHFRFEGASVFCGGDFVMPYGSHAVDLELANELIEKYPALFSDYRPAHYRDHCIEVQLPFLHHQLKGDYKIVPIILGTNNPETCREIALALKPYFNPDNLFIISTDFSHYPSYDDAIQVDKATKNAILSGNPTSLRATLADQAHKKIPNLVTGLCGWTSVLTLMYMAEKESNLCCEAVEYCNSGDVRHYGERDQVVGYWAIVVKEKSAGEKDEFALTETEKKILLQEARRTIENLFGTSGIAKPTIISETLQAKCGAFVTLHERGRLRGCIGMIAADKPLVETVRKMALSAARHDHRFMPVTEEELDEIEIEISVLSPLKLIHDVSEIKLGIHGVFIRQGSHTGVFLPQVATETGWSLDEFLGHCARDKAGIGWEGWKDADIYTFTATVFQEEK